MKRPLEIEIRLFNKKLSELIGEYNGENDISVKSMIDLCEVESYRERAFGDDSEVSKTSITIHMKSGDSVICYSHSYELFKNIMDEKRKPLEYESLEFMKFPEDDIPLKKFNRPMPVPPSDYK